MVAAGAQPELLTILLHLGTRFFMQIADPQQLPSTLNQTSIMAAKVMTLELSK